MPPGGLCGVVRFDGVPIDPEALRSMAAAEAWRGEAELAHRRGEPVGLAALGAASLAVSEERPALRVVADARLLRRGELAARLRAAGALEAPEPTDAALILAAYRAWGADCPDRLLGNFAFALWDGERRSLLCARDPVGVRSLHYSWRLGELRVATAAGQILAAGARRELDGFYLLDLLTANFREQARSPWAAVRRLLPGHALTADASGLRGWRYWRPERSARPGLSGEGDFVDALRELLERVVTDHLEDAGAAAMMTSGGVDSSLLAALAQDLHRRGHLATRPVAFIEVFERLRECDESEYSDVLVEETGIAAERLAADELSDVVRDPAWTGPVDCPTSSCGALSAAVLRRARERGCSVVTTGFGGDMLFDAAKLQWFDHVRRGRLDLAWPWIAGARARGAPWHRAAAAVLLPPLLTYGGRRPLDRFLGRNRYWQVPEWLRPELRHLAAERLGAQGSPRRRRGFARQLQYEHVVGLAQQGPAIGHWVVNAARFGLEARFPLLDRRLAELVLAAPIELGARPGPGRSKWLLREAARGVLPEAVRRRPDKGSWAAATREALCRRLASDLRERFGASLLAAMGLVEDSRVVTALDGICAAGLAEREVAHAHLLIFLYLSERWLREDAGEPGAPEFEELAAWEQERMI